MSVREQTTGEQHCRASCWLPALPSLELQCLLPVVLPHSLSSSSSSPSLSEELREASTPGKGSAAFGTTKVASRSLVLRWPLCL